MDKPIKGQYSKSYTCHNCGHSFSAVFQRGTVASQPECPKCGVHPSQLRYRKWRESEVWM